MQRRSVMRSGLGEEGLQGGWIGRGVKGERGGWAWRVDRHLLRVVVLHDLRVMRASSACVDALAPL